MDIVRKRFLVSGRVQGVGFRWFTRTCAERLGLAGFVRNLPDGRVHCEVEGPAQALTSFEAEVRRGPPAGEVTALEVTPLPAEGRGGGFVVAR